MDEGYIKLFRQSIDSWVFAHQTAWKIWTWCLMRASYKPRNVSIKVGKGVTIVAIKEGEFVFGRNKAEEALGIDGATISRWLNIFASDKNNMVSLKVSSHYTIVTICNWAKYQEEENNSELPLSNQRAGIEQPLSTNKKDKKDNKEKKNNTLPQNPVAGISEHKDFLLFKETVEKFHAFMVKTNPDLMRNVRLNVEKSAKVLDELIRLDGYSLKEIQNALNFGVTDKDFWSTQILSIANLRVKGKNGFSKFQNLFAKYKASLNGNGKHINGSAPKQEVYVAPPKKEWI